ncbi:hypothetical protein ILUMI_26909 [Ignelater luminosus]|uniref:Uncharacterized protein n=1 Tax=Ignelater luminosus TaxID=2038154 RepID=A0A8K0C3X9_IGNLU|nr:hypothetical protein ILUMI_26909 [Ignelater luminosus]
MNSASTLVVTTAASPEACIAGPAVPGTSPTSQTVPTCTSSFYQERKTSNQDRKAASSCLITQSPYKEQLTQSLNKSTIDKSKSEDVAFTELVLRDGDGTDLETDYLEASEDKGAACLYLQDLRGER